MKETVIGGIIEEILPHATKGERRRVRKLIAAKKINLIDEAVKQAIINIYASVVRHNSTNYDSAVKAVSRKKARFYVQPVVSNAVVDATGGASQ